MPAILVLCLFLVSCNGPEHVSPSEFSNRYSEVGLAQTVRNVTYLGQRDGRAYLQVSSMSLANQQWSEHVIYVELSELESLLRNSLPKTELKVMP
jgi:hypothetical protein